jgi:TPP-dependent 2-oxoacid decarboxylase
MTIRQTIGTAVLDRLHRLGVRHIFGIPGDYVLNLYKLIETSPITHIGTTREDCAGFAADAYARINGIGAVCVTYCVGGLNTVNAIACAYAERSPVVLLTGSPGLCERACNPYLHHMVRDFSTQREVFERMTVARSASTTRSQRSGTWTALSPPYSGIDARFIWRSPGIWSMLHWPRRPLPTALKLRTPIQPHWRRP